MGSTGGRLLALGLILVGFQGCSSTSGGLESLKAEERSRIANACVKDVREREFLGWKRIGDPADLQAACWNYAKAAVR
jgi:hypothetical protein